MSDELKEVTRQRDLLIAAMMRIRDDALSGHQMRNIAHDVIVEIVDPDPVGGAKPETPAL